MNKQTGFIFIIIVALILTGNIIIILMGILLIVGTYQLSTEKKVFPLLVLIGFYFFYPENPAIINHSRFFVYLVFLSFISILIYFQHPVNLFKINKPNNFLSTLIYIWIIWGSVIYLWVVLAFGLNFKVSSYYSPNVLNIVKYITTILAVIFSAIPIITLKSPNDFQLTIKYLYLISALFLALSLFAYITKIEILPIISDGSIINGLRMTGLSNADALGFGRKLLWPLFVITSYYLFSKKRKFLLLSIVFVVSILLTFSKTTYISSLFGLSLIVFIRYGKFKIKTILAFIIVIIGLIVLVKLFNVITIFSTTDRGTLGNLDVRLGIQSVALEIISSNPIFGAFPGGLFPALRHFGYTYRMMSVHSFYLSTPVEWGVILGATILLINLMVAIIHFKNLKILKSFNIKYSNSLKAFSLGGAAASLSFFVHGIAEIVPLFLVFLNLGFALAIDKVIKMEIVKNIPLKKVITDGFKPV